MRIQKRRKGEGRRCLRLISITSLALFLIASNNFAQGRPKDMVLIPPGTFVMGSAADDIARLKHLYNVKRDDLFSDEVPAHKVRLDAFYIDKYEVTNAKFAKFLKANKDWLPGRMPAKYDNGKYLASWKNSKEIPTGEENFPVTNMNWYAAMAYCRWEGKRLPTEAEWEFAARGGLVGEEFPWGNSPADLSHANYSKSGFGKTVRVGNYPANGYGLFDMAGNVWEFTADEWGSYSAADATNPLAGPNIFDSMNFDLITTRRVIRGGSWGGSPINLRVAYRDSHPPTGSENFVGFRCVMPAGLKVKK